MHKLLLLLFSVLLLNPTYSWAQRKCATPIIKDALIASDPSWKQILEDQRNSFQSLADASHATHNAAAKTTTSVTIPVIFHILVTSGQFDSLGGTSGIAQRIDSQITVLNRDFNAQNLDSVLIPAGWKPLFAASGIHFGLAHTSPSGYGSPGYEIRIVPNSPGGFGSVTDVYSSAKHYSSGGLDSWDPTKYINIWCINPADIQGLLGATISKALTTGTPGYTYPLSEEGICIYWMALGKRVSTSDYYPPAATLSDYYDQGRTLTHEMGHFFELIHTWGDDNDFCPWSGLHKDDGLADTPPEAGPKFDNTPYTITNGTYYDACQYDTALHDVQTPVYGVACLDFMNYTDDIAMHLFTPDQVAVMASMVAPGGENHSLTLNPDLLNWSLKTGIDDLATKISFALSPNPASTQIALSFNSSVTSLQSISITNTLGQQLLVAVPDPKSPDFLTIDLSTFPKGIYFVNCNFAAGSITRKILLQ